MTSKKLLLGLTILALDCLSLSAADVLKLECTLANDSSKRNIFAINTAEVKEAKKLKSKGIGSKIKDSELDFLYKISCLSNLPRLTKCKVVE